MFSEVEEVSGITKFTYVALDIAAAKCAEVLLELNRADMLRNVANEQTHF